MRVALLIAALVLAVGPQASAQQKSRYTVAKASAPSAPVLRGTQSAPQPSRPVSPMAPTPPEDPSLPEPIGGAASVRWTVKPDRSAAGQCRSACDKTYYACLSADDAQGCSSSWGQCRSKCERRRS